MAVRVRFPLRVQRCPTSYRSRAYLLLVRGNQSVGGVSGNLPLLDCCLLVQILVFAKRLCLKTSFHTSFHNHDNLRLQQSRCGHLSTAATVRFRRNLFDIIEGHGVGNQSVGGGVAKLSAIVCVGVLLCNYEPMADI